MCAWCSGGSTYAFILVGLAKEDRLSIGQFKRNSLLHSFVERTTPTILRLDPTTVYLGFIDSWKDANTFSRRAAHVQLLEPAFLLDECFKSWSRALFLGRMHLRILSPTVTRYYWPNILQHIDGESRALDKKCVERIELVY
jgi:hypothetical protein